MSHERKPRANPEIVFREESDEISYLFDPGDGSLFGLNPLGAFIWARLDGRRTRADLVREIREQCAEAPEDADRHLDAFLEELAGKNLLSYEEKRGEACR